MTSVLKRHSLVAFFVLAFGISWGNYPLSRAWPNFPFLFPYGPLLAAVIVASVTRGRDGLKDLLNRCLRWRVELKWYLAALLVPVAIAIAAVSLNILLGAPMPKADRFGHGRAKQDVEGHRGNGDGNRYEQRCQVPLEFDAPPQAAIQQVFQPIPPAGDACNDHRGEQWTIREEEGKVGPSPRQWIIPPRD